MRLLRRGFDRIPRVVLGCCLVAGTTRAEPSKVEARSQESRAELARRATPGGARPEPIEVTVQGEEGPARASRRDSVAASTVIPKAELRSPGASSADVLARVPGVLTTQTGGGSDLATASMRGASSAQLPVYLGGVRINDDVTGTADLSTVPLWMLGRVEVFRGNAPWQADRLGLGGAVFFEPELPSATRARAGTSLGSFGYRGLWAATSVNRGRSAAVVALRREKAQNDYSYLNDGGTRFDTRDDRVAKRVNADQETWDFWNVTRHRVGRSARVLTLLNALSREQGVTGLSVVPARRARSRVSRLLGAVSTLLPCRAEGAGEASSCRIELSTSWVLAATTLLDPVGEIAAAAAETTSRGERLAQAVRVSSRLSRSVELGFAVDPALERLTIERSGAVSHADRASARTLVRATVHPLPCLEILGMAFGEAYQTSSDTDRTGLEPGGRVGARFALGPELALLANLGHYLRLPTLGELYGVSPVVLGTPELEPEQGNTLDLGLRAGLSSVDRKHAIGLDAFVFAREARDLIAYRRSSLGVVRPFNVGAARVLGAEVAVLGRVFRLIRTELAATLLDARDRTPSRIVRNDLLPGMARLVGAGLVAVEQPWSPAFRTELIGRVRHVASRYADPAGLIVIPAQTTWDLEASAWLWPPLVNARAVLQNLTDAATFDVVGMPRPGRSLWASLEVVW